MHKTTEKQRKAATAYYHANKDKVAAYYREKLTDDQRERRRAATRRWKANNRARCNSVNRKHTSAYRKSPRGRLVNNLRSRLKSYLRQPLGTPSHHLFGCSSVALRLHIESLWVGGMTWKGYGRSWVIDHIKPLASFDLTDPQQRAQASHYTNLQPLWRVLNEAKGAKLNWDGTVR